MSLSKILNCGTLLSPIVHVAFMSVRENAALVPEGIQLRHESPLPLSTQHHQISSITLMLPGVSTSTVVIDGTACVGGNAISFASIFDEVW